jgi:hypothetical protein
MACVNGASRPSIRNNDPSNRYSDLVASIHLTKISIHICTLGGRDSLRAMALFIICILSSLLLTNLWAWEKRMVVHREFILTLDSPIFISMQAETIPSLIYICNTILYYTILYYTILISSSLAVLLLGVYGYFPD